jgi:hypothetical protein
MPPSVARLEQAQPPKALALVTARARHAPRRGAGGSHPIKESGDGE